MLVIHPSSPESSRSHKREPILHRHSQTTTPITQPSNLYFNHPLSSQRQPETAVRLQTNVGLQTEGLFAPSPTPATTFFVCRSCGDPITAVEGPPPARRRVTRWRRSRQRTPPATTNMAAMEVSAWFTSTLGWTWRMELERDVKSDGKNNRPEMWSVVKSAKRMMISKQSYNWNQRTGGTASRFCKHCFLEAL